MSTPRKPSAICEIRTGAVGKEKGDGSFGPPEQFKWGEVWKETDDGEWEPHPAFGIEEGDEGEKIAGQHRRFIVELTSNVIQLNFQSHLACYTGKSAFCFRAHRGDDLPGIAQRRDRDGGLFLTECDPRRCDLRRNAENAHSRTDVIRRDWNPIYKYAKLMDTQNKWNRDKKQHERVEVAARCMPYMFFIFYLRLPDDSGYAHPEGEICMLDSKSDTNHGRLWKKLKRLWVRCGGQLAGLRLELVYRPFVSKYGGDPKPAWDLRVPEGTDFETLRLQAAQRTAVWSARLQDLPTEGISTALVRANEGKHLAQYVAEDYPEAIRGAMDDSLDLQQIRAETINPADVYLVQKEPIIQELIKRCELPYALETRFPADFGENFDRALKWLIHYATSPTKKLRDADGNVIDEQPKPTFPINDILQKHGYAPVEGPQADEADQPAPVAQEQQPAAQDEGTGIVDAEYTEVKDDPPAEPELVDDFAAVRGQQQGSAILDQMVTTAAEELNLPVAATLPKVDPEQAERARLEELKNLTLPSTGAEKKPAEPVQESLI